MQLRERLAHAGVTAPPEARVRREAPVLPRGFVAAQTRQGEAYFRDQYFPLDFRHGRLRLDAALDLAPDLLARLGPELTQIDLTEAAYLDIETTGLSGGAGTYSFLVGVGTFEALSFRVRQFFLPSPDREAAMLSAIAETVDRCRALVTFNGKSFDLPQLAARCALSRVPPLGEGLPHVDLLHPARRLFAQRLESCRLADIERSLLRVRRQGDISGALVPALYFAYIRRRDVNGLHPVFEHNTLDVLSLVAFLAHLSRVAGDAVPEDADHALAVGRWDEKSGRFHEAEALYLRAWQLDPRGDAGAEAVWRLARLVRRRDWRAAADLWHQEHATADTPRRRLRAATELAKVAEHRRADPGEALRLALSAHTLLSEHGLGALLPQTQAALVGRISRLRGRLEAGSATQTLRLQAGRDPNQPA